MTIPHKYDFILLFMIPRLVVVFYVVVLVHRFIFNRLVVMFYLYVGNSNKQNIFDQIEIINQIMIVNKL